MSIASVDGAAMVDTDGVTRALLSIYPAAAISNPKTDSDGGWHIDINSADESWFRVGASDDGSQIGINGTFDQDARVAAALRAQMARDAARVIAIEPELGFVELPWGITAERIAAGWRPFDEFSENG